MEIAMDLSQGGSLFRSGDALSFSRMNSELQGNDINFFNLSGSILSQRLGRSLRSFDPLEISVHGGLVDHGLVDDGLENDSSESSQFSACIDRENNICDGVAEDLDEGLMGVLGEFRDLASPGPTQYSPPPSCPSPTYLPTHSVKTNEHATSVEERTAQAVVSGLPVPSISLLALRPGQQKLPVVFQSHPEGKARGAKPELDIDLDATVKRSFAPSPEPQTRGRRRNMEDEAGLGSEEAALKRCQESVDRVERLYQALEVINSGAWSASASQSALETKLRANPYYLEIQARILSRKIEWLQSNVKVLSKSIEMTPPCDLGLSGKARECSREATLELMQLRQMEKDSRHTLRKMLGNLSDHVPVFAEEVHTALGRAGPQFYDPAKKALSEVVTKNLQRRSQAGVGAHKIGNVKRGHLSQASVDKMEAWLVEHFDHPYPNAQQKQELVAQTGLSLGQVTNWLSNARIRIWRPAVESMCS